MSAALVLTGAPGAGKSSVLGALATRLEIEGIDYGAIESEQLGTVAATIPRLDGIDLRVPTEDRDARAVAEEIFAAWR